MNRQGERKKRWLLHPDDIAKALRMFGAGWTVQEDGDGSPLLSLQGKPLDGDALQVFLGPVNRFGARYFSIFLVNARGRLSQGPVLLGLYHQGIYPSYNWVEIILLNPEASFPSEGEEAAVPSGIEKNDLIAALFHALCPLIPPGGHIMAEYDSPEQEETRNLLARGVPPVATPLGYLLFSSGCGVWFKDWHLAEGGNEGPRKLQGYKALDKEHARQRREEMAQELRAFLEQESPRPSPPELRARERAIAILHELSALSTVNRLT